MLRLEGEEECVEHWRQWRTEEEESCCGLSGNKETMLGKASERVEDEIPGGSKASSPFPRNLPKYPVGTFPPCWNEVLPKLMLHIALSLFS